LNNSLALIKDFIFNIYILKQATFEIVYICFSVTAHFAIPSLQNNIKRYHLYQDVHILVFILFLLRFY